MLRRGALSLAAACLICGPLPAAEPATYRVEVVRLDPPKLAVTADLPVSGSDLVMDTTRPGDIPELDAHGWPALIKDLEVSDGTGEPIGVTAAGASGWRLKRQAEGRLSLRYQVDYEALAKHGWPAPREAGLFDGDNLVIAGRSLFITTSAVETANVSFAVPNGWQPVTAWAPRRGSVDQFDVRSVGDLVENLVVVTNTAPDVVRARGFRVLVAAMGHWRPARPEIRHVIAGVVARFVALMGFSGRENYLVVLLPNVERGGEAYRRSFALTANEPPTLANSASWGNILAHEIFHCWNGWRLRGAEYAGSQWFQEGFTEYAANLAMVQGRLIDSDRFLAMLSNHVENYRRLETTLEAIGTHKGPPLYSGGALVAFSWDVLIRSRSGDRHDFGFFLRELWRVTGGAERPYAWPEILAALDRTAPGDWDAFYRSYIQGKQALPLDEAFGLVGLRLVQAGDGQPRVELNPDAPAPSKSRWQSLVKGR